MPNRTISISNSHWERAKEIGRKVTGREKKVASQGIRTALDSYFDGTVLTYRAKNAIRDLRRIQSGKEPFLYNIDEIVRILEELLG